VLGLGAGLMLVALAPLPASAGDDDAAEAIRREFGDAPMQEGRITLKLPALAESGNSVPLTVSVDSPMTERDRVRRVAVFANRNPRPLVATMIFGPRSGKPVFNTNMRLSGTQDVIVVAEMADGSRWKTAKRVMVTVGACDSLQMRY
jgi:sulfur-oxidizing protein SoxY